MVPRVAALIATLALCGCATSSVRIVAMPSAVVTCEIRSSSVFRRLEVEACGATADHQGISGGFENLLSGVVGFLAGLGLAL